MLSRRLERAIRVCVGVCTFVCVRACDRAALGLDDFLAAVLGPNLVLDKERDEAASKQKYRQAGQNTKHTYICTHAHRHEYTHTYVHKYIHMHIPSSHMQRWLRCRPLLPSFQWESQSAVHC